MLCQKRPLVTGITLLLSFFLPPSVLSQSSEIAQDPPNIIFILADDMGIGDVGIYNPDAKIPTPHIDQLAQQGMYFTDAHAPGSVCVPTRYGLLTGEYPFRTDWRQWNKQAVIESGQMTIASLLKESSYQTGMVGKWHLGFEGGNEFDCTQPLRGGPVDHGFDYFYGMHASLDIPPYFYIQGDECVTAPTQTTYGRRSSRSYWNDIQGPFWRSGSIAPGFHFDNVLPRWREQAVSFIEDQHRNGNDSPFFLYLALTAPHTPWLPLEPFQGVSRAGQYGDFVAQVDDMVARILSTLNRLNLEDNTLVIFTSDNGPVWYGKDERRFNHRATGIYRGMKGDAWEGGHRMPFVTRWPGHIPAGSRSNETISFTDMMATFAAVTGSNVPREKDSHSILPVLFQEEQEEPVRTTIAHGAVRYLAVRQGDWKLIPGLGSGGFSKPQTQTPGPGQPEGQLYNLDEDPAEQHNIYEKHPDIVRRLTDLLNHYRQESPVRPRE